VIKTVLPVKAPIIASQQDYFGQQKVSSRD
jgi:hypothetical protein